MAAAGKDRQEHHSDECAQLCEIAKASYENGYDLADGEVLFELIRNCPACAELFSFEVELRRKVREELQNHRRQAPSELHFRIRVSIHRETLSRLQVIRAQQTSFGAPDVSATGKNEDGKEPAGY